MRSKSPLFPLFALSLVLLLGLAAPARAEHRATHLGNPTGRFAHPLSTPDDLRARFRDPKLKPDIAEILRQWGWTGNLDDLHLAAQTAPITEVKLPVGTRMPFMSSRKQGKPVCLKDVLWVGKEPVDAYAFTFASKGRRYRCVTPKACSNFYLEEAGPELPELLLVKTAPAEAGLCGPFEIKLVFRNVGGVPATQVRVTDTLPAGLKTPDNQTEVAIDVGTLAPGQGREVRIPVVAATAGTFENVARITSAEGVSAEAKATTTVKAAVLELACSAPATVIAGRPARVCLTVRNTGSVPEAGTTVTLPVPAGATVTGTTEGGVTADGVVTWEIADLAPGASKDVCAVLTKAEPGALAFAPAVKGACAPPVQSQCATKFVGITAMLLEVVDLEDPVEVGKEVTYEVRVTNQGFAVGTNLKVVCTLPESQQFVSGSGTTPVRLENGAVVMDLVPSIEGKVAVSWKVVIRALKADDARFKVQLLSDQFTQPIHEDESTQQY